MDGSTQAAPLTDGALYRRIVEITIDYLGPAAEKFITRQIQVHLNKMPEQLEPQDVIKLTDWVKIAIALLTEDSKMVDAYAKDLHALASVK